MASLLAQRLHVRGDELLDQAVEAARAQGASWTEIGGALQTSKQAAQQRFAVVAEVPAGDSPFGLTGAAADVLAAAADEARELGHHYVRPEHLLLGLLSLPEEMAGRALEADGVTADVARAALVKQFPRAASRPTGSDPAEIRKHVMRMILEQSPELAGALSRQSWLSRLASTRR